MTFCLWMRRMRGSISSTRISALAMQWLRLQRWSQFVTTSVKSAQFHSGLGFMDLAPVIIAQPEGFRRQWAGNHPTDRDGGVNDVLHASSSSSSNSGAGDGQE